MKDWKGCPKCWGTGLVGGFSRPCEEFNLRDLQKEPLTQDEMLEFFGREPELMILVMQSHTMRELGDNVARLLTRMLLQAVFRV